MAITLSMTMSLVVGSVGVSDSRHLVYVYSKGEVGWGCLARVGWKCDSLGFRLQGAGCFTPETG